MKVYVLEAYGNIDSVYASREEAERAAKDLWMSESFPDEEDWQEDDWVEICHVEEYEVQQNNMSLNVINTSPKEL